MRRRGSNSIVANPVLVGAVTTLVILVAVFLAYNANNGLPFVPTRSLSAQVVNGSELVKGNEVREGGYRVGVVEDMIAVKLPNGKVGAQIKLKLDKKVGALPVDTTVEIRPRSALGLKYVEVTKGSSSQTLPDGATLPPSSTSAPVELDAFYNMFDAKTREGARKQLKGFGDAFTGRGYDLNVTIQKLPALFRYLEPVMRNLSDKRTQLKNFFKALGDTARVVAPVADINARLFTTMADTFAAINKSPQALKDTISKSPPTEAVAEDSLRTQTPFLKDTADFSHDLRLSVHELRGALPVLNSALRVGVPVTKRSIGLNDDLAKAMDALRELTTQPQTAAALRGLTATVATLQPQLRFLGPYVTVCNYWNSFWTFTAEHFTAPDPTGSAERALLNSAGQQDNSIGAMGATLPANGENVIRGAPQFLHDNFYGAAITKDGRADCEAGQQGYIYGTGNGLTANPFNPAFPRVVLDPGHSAKPTDVIQGPTYKTYDRQGHGHGLNIDRVPKGETYTSVPGGTGPGRAVD